MFVCAVAKSNMKAYGSTRLPLNAEKVLRKRRKVVRVGREQKKNIRGSNENTAYSNVITER